MATYMFLDSKERNGCGVSLTGFKGRNQALDYFIFEREKETSVVFLLDSKGQGNSCGVSSRFEGFVFSVSES